MLTKKQLKIIDAFRKNLGMRLTAEQLRAITGIKSNNFLYKALGNAMHEGIIKTQTIGKSLLYNLEINHKSASYLGILGSELYALPQEILDKIEKQVTKKTIFFTATVFGSYAGGKQKKDSDFDIAFVVKEKKDIDVITPILESIKRKEILSIHFYVFTASDFIKMLKADEENLGKQIVKNHLTFYNPHLFYNLIKPWIR
ncbi:MAG: nucleotidyltransferase domain-containing protein [Nanoarchaeota archaeon]